jgi:hypothetical protein
MLGTIGVLFLLLTGWIGGGNRIYSRSKGTPIRRDAVLGRATQSGL